MRNLKWSSCSTLCYLVWLTYYLVHDNYSCLYWFNIHHYFEFYQWPISDLSGFVINVWRDSQGQPKHCLEMSFRGNSRVSCVISVSNSCIYINRYLSEFAMEAGISAQFPSPSLPWPLWDAWHPRICHPVGRLIKGLASWLQGSLHIQWKAGPNWLLFLQFRSRNFEDFREERKS